jgi:hypothetical protein
MEGPRTSIPLTDHDRAARHFGVEPAQVTAEMVEQLPPRGTGLQTGQAREIDEDIDMAALFFLYHSVAYMETENSPGIVVYPDQAKASPCKCAKVDGSELCFSRGIIGAMDEGQKDVYCTEKDYFKSPALQRRARVFKQSVKAAQKKVKDIPRGERLQPWLETMSEELSKRGAKV